MDRRDLQLSLVQGLLAAPGSTEGWERFLLQLCDALHGSAANFMSHSFESGHTSVSITARTDPRAVDEYQKYWCEQDPWRNAVAHPVEPGTVLLGDGLISSGQISHTAFYNDFGRRYGITQCIAGILEMSPQALSNISVNGTDRRRRFDSHDADLLGSLMPHVKRAIDVHRRLAGAELMAAHASAVLERLPHGVMLISATGAVVSTNRTADAILRARDGLALDRGELRAATPSITARLQSVLNAAVRTSRGVALDGATPLALPRPSGRRPLSVLVAPLPSARAALTSDAAAVALFVTDPDHVAMPDAETIRTLFDLTRGESELVSCIVAGLSLEQATAQLGLRPQTLRTRLKIVFQKTNTHRQAELVRLVLTSTARLT
jgi:DNA-binding CsgD family transcriptional regulator